MSVAEKPRTKIDLVTRTVLTLECELAEIRERLAELPDLEHAARVAAVKEAPTKSGARPGRGAYELIAEKRQLEEREIEVVKDLEAAKDARATIARELARETLAPLVAKAKGLRKQHLGAIKRLGEQFSEMLETIYGSNGVVTLAEELDALSLANETAVAECEDPELKTDAVAAFQLPVQPFPVSLEKLFELLIAAACDPHASGYREGGARLDGADLLVDLIPDCRGVIRTPVLSGRVDRVGRPEQAGQDFYSGLRL